MFGELDGTSFEQAANRLAQHISSTYVLETYTLCKLVSGCCNAKGCQLSGLYYYQDDNNCPLLLQVMFFSHDLIKYLLGDQKEPSQALDTALLTPHQVCIEAHSACTACSLICAATVRLSEA